MANAVSLFRSRRTVVVALFVLAVAAAPGRALAVDSCKAKIDKKTGVVTMSATNVVGLFGWRDANSDDLVNFHNAGCTVVGDDLFGCPLADPATSVARIPPPSCEVCIADTGGTECCARLKNCTPGTRDCQVVSGQVPVASSATEALTVSCPDGYKATGGGGSLGVFFGFYPLQVSIPSANGESWTCQANNFEPISGTLNCRVSCCRVP